MPKDPVRNVDRYKIRGGQLNAFEFHQNQGAVSEQQQEHGNWMGAPEGSADLPPDKAKAERIRRLLAEHGESVPQTEERQPEGYEMEERETEEGRNAPDAQMASERPAAENEDRQTNAEGGEEDFAPTHGRSPEVIREMMESRRATDRVPDPEDIVAGRPEQSREKKEHGQTGRGTAARRANKPPARAAKPAKAAKGKEAALDRSKPGVAKGTSAKKDAKQSAPRQGTGRQGTGRKSTGGAPTKASGRQTGNQSATARGTARAAASTAGKQATSGKGAKATTSKGGQQAAGRKSTAGTSARNGARNSAGSRSAQSRTGANGRATTAATKSGRTAAPTRVKSPAGRNR